MPHSEDQGCQHHGEDADQQQVQGPERRHQAVRRSGIRDDELDPVYPSQIDDHKVQHAEAGCQRDGDVIVTLGSSPPWSAFQNGSFDGVSEKTCERMAEGRV